jgi:hypothetical protein
MMQSPPCMVREGGRPIPPGSQRPSRSRVATNNLTVKARTIAWTKVRIELQGRAKTVNILSQP